MSDIALNGHGRPLSMTDVAIRRRASRFGIPVGVYRDMGAGHIPGHVPKVTPKATGSPPLDIRLATSRDGPSCDVSRDRKATSHGTRSENQRLRVVTSSQANGVTHPIGMVTSPSLQPGQSPAVASQSRGRLAFLRGTVALLAVLFSIASIGTNSTYLVSQGTTSLGMACLGIAALSYELGLVVMPTVLVELWRQRDFALCFWGILFTAVCFMTAVYAATGFVNANFGDTEAKRYAEVTSRSSLTAELKRMQAERDAITVVPTSQAAIDLAALAVKRDCPIWNKTDSCKMLRSKHQGLVEQIARNDKAAELDTKIPAMQAKVDGAPTTKWADPQIEGVILLFSGTATVGRHHAEVGRIVQFIMLPIGAGLLWAFAAALGTMGRPAERRIA